MKKIRIAINGFGRIGRLFFRQAFGLPEFEIKAINDLGDINNLAYLLKYDSVYGRFDKSVESRDGNLVIAGETIQVYQQKDPSNLPWNDLKIDIVIESTGFFTSSEKSQAHLDAGAKRVIISAPAKGEVTTALVGVNDDRFANAGPITCNASCTTNSTAPVLAILLERFGINYASMTTVHGYTATQRLVDGPDAKDVRRGRAAASNIVPTTTGAARAVIQSIPELDERFFASAVRVPVIAGSLSIITALLKKSTTIEELNNVFREAAKDVRWSKTIAVSEDPIVSADIIGQPYGAIIDLTLSEANQSGFVKIFSWYDNEYGYTATLVEHAKKVAQQIQN